MSRRIGLTMRVASTPGYSEARDALAHDWYGFLDFALPDAEWLLVPNLGAEGARSFARREGLDAVILTGGNDIGESHVRDASETALLSWALDADVPVLGVCRGLQLIQHVYGGPVATCERARHVATSHRVQILESFGPLEAGRTLDVNSFHQQAVHRAELASPLTPLVVSEEDGIVEGLRDPGRRVLGLQWHPERTRPYAETDRRLVRQALGMAG